MKKQIDYKKIINDIKNNKLLNYYNNYLKYKNEKHTKLYVLSLLCKNSINKDMIYDDKILIKILKSFDTIIKVKVSD